MTCTSLKYVCWVLTNARSSQPCLPSLSADNLVSCFTEKIEAIKQAVPTPIWGQFLPLVFVSYPLPPSQRSCSIELHFKKWACLSTNAGLSSLLPQNPHTRYFLFLEQLSYFSFTYHNSYFVLQVFAWVLFTKIWLPWLSVPQYGKTYWTFFFMTLSSP